MNGSPRTSSPDAQTAAKVQPYPKPGDVWRSRDRRDHGLTVTVLAVDEPEGRVRIKRFRKATVSIRNWLRLYEFVSRVES